VFPREQDDYDERRNDGGNRQHDKIKQGSKNLLAELSAITPQSRSSSQIVAKNSLADCALMCRSEQQPCSVSIIGRNFIVEF
jgi:hypothetical protein